MKISILAFIFTVCFALSAAAQLTSSRDIIPAENCVLTVYPINHGSVVFTFNGTTVFADPFGGAYLYEQFDAPDIILITHTHGDHFNPETLSGLNTNNTTFIVPETVANEMGDRYSNQMQVIANDESITVMDIPVRAVAMYNLPGDETVRHKKGDGNGYVIDFGSQSVYVSGDTEDTPEMRALEAIDIAFVCMNLPYTMDIERAASAVIDFQPGIVYPYHHRGQDIVAFKQLVDAANVGVEVRLKDWYSN
jgi:L-ascorbate metabolism protein UlaG (beta-lactamase superfamily)